MRPLDCAPAIVARLRGQGRTGGRRECSDTLVVTDRPICHHADHLRTTGYTRSEFERAPASQSDAGQVTVGDNNARSLYSARESLARLPSERHLAKFPATAERSCESDRRVRRYLWCAAVELIRAQHPC